MIKRMYFIKIESNDSSEGRQIASGFFSVTSLFSEPLKAKEHGANYLCNNCGLNRNEYMITAFNRL